jgi:hypothetical protein
MLRDREVDDSPALVCEQHQDEQHTSSERRDREEIHRDQGGCVIGHERSPRLGGGRRCHWSSRDTVRSETWMPSFCNSPWIRGAPRADLQPTFRSNEGANGRINTGAPGGPPSSDVPNGNGAIGDAIAPPPRAARPSGPCATPAKRLARRIQNSQSAGLSLGRLRVRVNAANC